MSCSAGLYAVQEGFMDVQEGYMLKKIMMEIMASNVIASQPPEWRPTATPISCTNSGYLDIVGIFLEKVFWSPPPSKLNVSN